jgi:hypothetical protein
VLEESVQKERLVPTEGEPKRVIVQTRDDLIVLLPGTDYIRRSSATPGLLPNAYGREVSDPTMTHAEFQG